MGVKENSLSVHDIFDSESCGNKSEKSAATNLNRKRCYAFTQDPAPNNPYKSMDGIIWLTRSMFILSEGLLALKSHVRGADFLFVVYSNIPGTW